MQSLKMSQKKIKALILEIMLISLVFSICADPSQPENRCSACAPIDILINQTCYSKIRGCLKHEAGPSCSQCVFGYVLSNRICIREAIFFNRTNLTYIPPVLIDDQTLTMQEIKIKLGEKNNKYFANSHEYFVSKYSNQLGKGIIKSVDSLQTKSGTLLIFVYEVKSNLAGSRYYEAISLATPENKVQEVSFGEYQGVGKDPIAADISIRKALGTASKYYDLYQLKVQKDVYQVDYINQDRNVIRISMNKKDINSDLLDSKIQKKALTLEDLGLQKVFDAYPIFKGLQPSSVKKVGDFSIVNFGPIISISYKFSNSGFKINKPLSFPTDEYVASDISFKGVKTSQFTTANDTSTIQFITFATAIIKQFQQLIGCKVTKVLSFLLKQNKGYVYLFFINKNLDNYELVAWRNSSRLPAVTLLKKNGKNVYQEYYNYNDDNGFLRSYRTVQTGSSVTNVPPISWVSLRVVGNKNFYKIYFSPIQFAEMEYQPDTGKSYLLTYFIDGQNIIKTLNSPRSIGQRRSYQELLGFIRNKTNGTSLARIKQVLYNLPLYVITVVTYQGTYTAFVEDRGTELLLNQYTKITNETCFQLNIFDFKNNAKIAQLQNLFKSNYENTQQFTAQLVQVNPKQFSIGYRVIFANPKTKQIMVYFDQIDGKSAITNANILNSGYETVNADPTTTTYLDAVYSIQSSNLLGNGTPYFVQGNSSVLKIYYNDGKNLYEVLYDRLIKRVVDVRIDYIRSYLLIPEGFTFENLIIPGNPSTQENATLDKIYETLLNRYPAVVKDSVIAFAQKNMDTYNIILFNSGFGYQKTQAVVDKVTGSININLPSLTKYPANSFSNCKRFDQKGKCLSCNTSTQIEFQGYCFKKLEGCNIQAANYCIKCNSNYNKRSRSCVKQCSLYF